MSQFKPNRDLRPNPPISLTPSPPHEEFSAKCLEAYLDRVCPLETDEEREVRETVLSDLNRQFKQWVCDRAVALGLYPDVESAAGCVGGTMLLAGSYRLGINDKDSDVDATCLCPSFITREDFFTTWKAVVQAHPDLTDFTDISGAKNAILNCRIKGIELDMSYTRLQTPTVPLDVNILDDAITAGMDSGELRAINGPRVTELIYQLVPNCEAPWKVVARALRLWAKQRYLYSNMMGFLGGVNVNIMAAYVCQLFPHTSPSKQLWWIFKLLGQWDWRSQPLCINQPYTDEALGHDMWDQFTSRDVMPILTPAYPASSSSYNVCRSTLHIMTEEFERGYEVVEAILKGEDPTRHDWSPLFSPSNFFTRFEHYIQLEISCAPDPDSPDPASTAKDMGLWKSWVQSRVIYLVKELERYLGLTAGPFVIFPCPKDFTHFTLVPEAPLPPLEKVKAEKKEEGDAPLPSPPIYSVVPAVIFPTVKGGTGAVVGEGEQGGVGGGVKNEGVATGSNPSSPPPPSSSSSDSPSASAAAGAEAGASSLPPIPAAEVMERRTTVSFFVGLEIDPDRSASSSVNITGVLSQFHESLTSDPSRFYAKPTMILKKFVRKWGALPEYLFGGAEGKVAAKKDYESNRARRRELKRKEKEEREATRKSRVFRVQNVIAGAPDVIPGAATTVSMVFSNPSPTAASGGTAAGTAPSASASSASSASTTTLAKGVKSGSGVGGVIPGITQPPSTLVVVPSSVGGGSGSAIPGLSAPPPVVAALNVGEASVDGGANSSSSSSRKRVFEVIKGEGGGSTSGDTAAPSPLIAAAAAAAAVAASATATIPPQAPPPSQPPGGGKAHTSGGGGGEGRALPCAAPPPPPQKKIKVSIGQMAPK